MRFDFRMSAEAWLFAVLFALTLAALIALAFQPACPLEEMHGWCIRNACGLCFGKVVIG